MTSNLSLEIGVEGRFDWLALTGFFAVRVIPGVDHVDGDTYARTFFQGRSDGTIAIRPGKTGTLIADILCSGTPDEGQLRERLGRLVNAAAPVRRIETHLRRSATLAPLLKKGSGARVPGTWDPFELGLRAILGQQVSVAGATTLAGRIATKFGSPTRTKHEALSRLFPRAEQLADASLDGLGLTTRRAATITGFARAVSADPSLLDTSKPLESFVTDLLALSGFGPWTAHYMAMRLGYPDAFPASDLGVRKALNMASEKDVLKLAEPWRPYRATAVMHLWRSLATT